mgnify:CR=1 FL=1
MRHQNSQQKQHQENQSVDLHSPHRFPLTHFLSPEKLAFLKSSSCSIRRNISVVDASWLRSRTAASRSALSSCRVSLLCAIVLLGREVSFLGPGTFQNAEPMSIVLLNIIVNRRPLRSIFRPLFGKAFQSSPRGDSACLFLFAIRSSRPCQPKHADNPGQRQSLEHECYQNDAECQKNNQIF